MWQTRCTIHVIASRYKYRGLMGRAKPPCFAPPCLATTGQR